jgi:hypothetical protein
MICSPVREPPMTAMLNCQPSSSRRSRHEMVAVASRVRSHGETIFQRWRRDNNESNRVAMRLYGYSKKKLSAQGLRELKQVTLMASPDDFIRLAKFLQTEARLMNKWKEKYDHAHFEYEPANGKRFTGLIVVPEPIRDC